MRESLYRSLWKREGIRPDQVARMTPVQISRVAGGDKIRTFATQSEYEKFASGF